MVNTTLSSSLHGLCPAPFYDFQNFGRQGYAAGRFCAPVPQIQQGLVCCLPCPATDYLYPSSFKTWYTVAECLNVVGLLCLAFLMASFICLPAEKTRRHYLSYNLIVAAIFIALGFVIPLGTRPEQCFDEITPNDMYSSLTCALSGAFIVAGGLSMTVWIFIRALSMHLQICWDVMPRKGFFYWSQGLGWIVAAAFFTTTMTVTGVSFRFGDVCHVNASGSMKDFWGPLLAISGAATLVQIATFGYCINVYLKNMWSYEKPETRTSSGLPSYTNSLRTRSARAVYRRVRKVLWLQWRGITVVVFILVDVIFFAIVFVYLNSMETYAADDVENALPFIVCLVLNPVVTDECFGLGQSLFVNEATVIAILLMLSLAGLQAFLLLARGSMFSAWADLVRSKTGAKQEFVSLDAKQYTHDPRDHELSKFPLSPIKAPDSAVTSPGTECDPYGRSFAGTPDDLGREVQREYRSPTLSFSAPRAPSQIEWDPRSTHARGGLGLHPLVDEDENRDVNKGSAT